MKSFLDFAERYGSQVGGYRDLFRARVHHVLLVSSLYESFILSEDGHIHEQFLDKFLEADLWQPPDLTRVSSGREALRILHQGYPRVDLVISSPDVGDMDALELAAEVDALTGSTVPVALLAYDHRELKAFSEERGPDRLAASFLWQGDARILLAIVKLVEDRLNVEHDTQVGVPVFLVVEDNIRYYSSFLPVIYSEVLNLTRSVQAEAGNRLQRLMRMRARPKILLSRDFEEAYRDFSTYQDRVMGVFSDFEFPRAGKLSPTAGLDLAHAFRELQHDVPITLQSSNPDNRTLAEELGSGFLLKGSADLLGQLREYLSGHLFFGDFVFRDREGDEIDRAADLKTLVELLRTVTAESVAFHANRNDFSRWLRARAEFALADMLRPRQLEDFPSVEALRDDLVKSIDDYRRERNRGTVIPFRSDLFDAEEGIVQIGDGSLGGKGRGLAFASRLLDEVRLGDRFPGVNIRVPPAVVLATGVFDRFLDDNELRTFALQCDDEAATVSSILAGSLPGDVVESLRQVVSVVRGPLAVRSSSLLEDSPHQPFAGMYGTWIIPNDAPSPGTRLAQLEDAVKRVYASTFTGRVRAFLDATPYRLEEEAMAVVIQQVVGRRHGTRFYPDFSGVARSHNHYPVAPARPEDGIAAVALGLGKTVAEGEPCLRFPPPYPEHIVEHSTVEDMLEHSQRAFWGLKLGQDPPESGWAQDGPLERYGLRTSEEDGTLAPVASTYSAENHAVYDGLRKQGVRLVTFAPILKHGVFPLAEILQELLILGMAGTRLPVEIEFAATLPARRGDPAELGFLQLRPLAITHRDDQVELEGLDREAVFCESPSVMGHGRAEIHDWVVVDRNEFDRSRSALCADDVRRFNAELRREGRPYGLIGVGRWGSTHPWLGIPVRWEDISGARVIVEAGFRDFQVVPSQGTHFFQNLVSLGVGYLTVNAHLGEGFVNWNWLAKQPAVESRGCVRHLRFDTPAVAIMDGRERRGAILKPDPSHSG